MEPQLRLLCAPLKTSLKMGILIFQPLPYMRLYSPDLRSHSNSLREHSRIKPVTSSCDISHTILFLLWLTRNLYFAVAGEQLNGICFSLPSCCWLGHPKGKRVVGKNILAHVHCF